VDQDPDAGRGHVLAVDAEAEPGGQRPARCVVGVDDGGEAVETQLGGCDVEPCPGGLAGEAAALRVPGEDVAELDLVLLRPGVQPGAAEEGSGLPVEERALTEAVLARQTASNRSTWAAVPSASSAAPPM
jgi:hypothetical protein